MRSNNRHTLADDEIIRKILEENEPGYFDVLYKRYFSKVQDKCKSIVKNRDLAEELAGDIMCHTYEKLASFKRISSFSSWLYSITYNYCIDYLRKKNKLHYPSWNRNNEIPEIIDDPDEDIGNINFENLMLILDLIHPEEKALLLMKYQDNLSIKQISAALRISDDAAKMRLKRARTRVLYLYSLKFMQDS
ncbi:MAG: RNA polymerase sigma factor [Bacteroidales bacterium]|nr:RNA polymerase sigma factor [Bacteroidales bacterium]